MKGGSYVGEKIGIMNTYSSQLVSNITTSGLYMYTHHKQQTINRHELAMYC